MTRQDQALQQLAKAQQRLIAAEEAEVQAVAAARQAGATWRQVADTLGIFESSTIRKYGKRIQETTERTFFVLPRPPDGRRKA